MAKALIYGTAPIRSIVFVEDDAAAILPDTDELRLLIAQWGPALVLDGTVVVDLERAKALHTARIAEARAKAAEALHEAYSRASFAGNAEATAAAKAEMEAIDAAIAALSLDAATTPDELATLWPEGLPR